MCLICFTKSAKFFQKRRQISSRPGSVSHVNAKNKNVPLRRDIPAKRDIPARRDHVNRPLDVKGLHFSVFSLVFEKRQSPLTSHWVFRDI